MDLEQIRGFTPEIMKIARNHDISRLFVFGSVARGENTEKSDIDFLVEMQDGASLFSAAGFSHDIEKLLGVSVDVVPVSLLPILNNQNFAKNIQREAIPL